MTQDVDNASHCERDNGSEDCEIEITPEMVEAGVKAFNLIDFESATEGASDWIIDIYFAMEAVKVRTGSGKHRALR